MRASADAASRRPWSRFGCGVVALVLFASVAGCGSRASDQEIAESLRGPASLTPAQQTAAVTSETGTASNNLVPGAGTASSGSGLPAQAPTDVGAKRNGSPAAGASSAATSAPGRSTTEAGRATPEIADKSLIKIGQLGSFSGVLGAVSAVGPKVMAAWISSTNAHGGLNGHPLQLIVGDDQGDPATSLTLAKRMVESDKILIMAGNFQAFGFSQVEAYMRSKNVPMIGDGVDPGWFTSPIAFTVVSPASTQIIQGLKTFVDEGNQKLGMFYCLEISQICTALHDAVKKSEVGQYVIQAYQVSLVAPSYTSQCLRMKQAGVEVLYLLMDNAGAARAAQDCANQGFKPKIELLSLAATADMPKMPALAGALVPSGTVSPGASGVPGLARYRELLGTYAASLGDSGISVYTFAAAQMVGFAGKNLPENPTSADFLAGLWKVKNETLGGLTVPLTFAKGKPVQAKQCAFIWGTENGRWSAPRGVQPIC